jgi:hypothetical protein
MGRGVKCEKPGTYSVLRDFIQREDPPVKVGYMQCFSQSDCLKSLSVRVVPGDEWQETTGVCRGSNLKNL